jgi:hypothetical protein
MSSISEQPLFLVGDELCLPSLALALACLRHEVSLSGVLGTGLRQQEGQSVIDRPHVEDVFKIGEGAFDVREGR